MADIFSHIVLTGICLFLRPEAGRPPEAAVFMEGRKSAAADMQHHVYLAVNAEDYDVRQTPDGALTPDIRPDAGGRKYRVYTLDDRLIRIKTTAKESVVKDELENSAVPHLGEVWPQMTGSAHSINKKLHLSKRDPELKDRVNGRLELPSGTLKVAYTNVHDEWTFIPSVPFNPQVKGPIPQEVTLDQTLVDSNPAIQLEIMNVDDASLVTVLTITRSTKHPGGDLLVLLANVPKADLFPSTRCTDVDCQIANNSTRDCCVDHHFKLYYNAFDRPPRNPPIPHKTAQLPIILPNQMAPPSMILPHDGSTELFQVGGANCGPAQQP
jgi:hypothetical protein